MEQEKLKMQGGSREAGFSQVVGLVLQREGVTRAIWCPCKILKMGIALSLLVPVGKRSYHSYETICGAMEVAVSPCIGVIAP